MFARRLTRLLGRTPPPIVPVVRLSGVIGALGGLRPGLTMETVAGRLERAFGLAHRAAVAIIVNSPGGSPAQSALIGRRIRQLADEKGVPTLAFVEDAAASGGYWIACAADEIIAIDSSIVGSIGVVSQSFGFQDLIARWGIERRLYTSGERKAMLDPFRPENPDDVERLKTLQAELHEQFKGWVRTRRGPKLKADEAVLFSGEFWTGATGLELGLVDALGDVRSVLRARFGETVVPVPIGERKPWIARRLGMATLEGGLAEEALATVELRAQWSRLGL